MQPATPDRSDVLRQAALVAVGLGVIGSLGLLFHASRHTPTFLRVIFVFWTLSPFAALLAANATSARWRAPTRTVLYLMMIGISVGSLAIYGDDARAHRRPQAAFVYVLVPPVSWALTTVALTAAEVTARRQRRARRSDAAH
jgi:uncharacterized membrane protein YsdA (DUF1294 family)